VTFAAVSLLAVSFAFLPRRRTIAQVGALSATVMIGLQLAVDHWFYLYIPWFLPGLLVALLATGASGGVRSPAPG
jgi:hypothetical protein